MTGPLVSLERLKERIMARKNLTLGDCGVEQDLEVAIDSLVDLLHQRYRAYTLDELLLRPREALRFCDAARELFGDIDIPDDVILRAVLNRRKHP